MSLREPESVNTVSDSEPVTSYDRDFDSEDCFLMMIGRKVDNLPQDHYIRPFLPEGSSNLGELHFLPHGKAITDSSKRTEFLYIWVNGFKEYLTELETNPLINYDLIYIRTDPQMASVAKWTGFTAVEPKEQEESSSVILCATPDKIKETFEKHKKDGTIDKIVNRYKRLYSTDENLS